MYLISPDKKQYKANLHSHSTNSDGAKTPEELRDMYKSHGYSVLAITDHEYPCDHSGMSTEDFVMLTGYEVYIRPSKTCVYDVFSPEIHLNLFARDPHNETIIGYHSPCFKYLPKEKQESLPHGGVDGPREYTREYVNSFIRAAKDHGYIVGHNHPYWSMESEADVLAVEGCFSMEMVNYNSYLSSGLEHNGALYDRLLQNGKRIFCHGADDNHNRFPVGDPGFDSFGGFTMILADSLDYDSVFGAMERGDMYSSMGPEIKSVEYRDGCVRVECSPAAKIFAYTGRKHPRHVFAPMGETITSAEIPVDAEAKYLRVSVVDREGRWADTRGYSREELGI